MTNIIKFIVVLFLLFLMNSCQQRVKISCEVSEYSKMGMNHFNPLIDAMERYKDDNGHYPKEDIFLLIPKYIEKIPIIRPNTEGMDETKFNILISDKIDGGDHYHLKMEIILRFGFIQKMTEFVYLEVEIIFANTLLKPRNGNVFNK